jgi:hypothetical protein
VTTQRRAIGLGVALALLNTSLTFGNVWPTLGVRPRGGVSIELCFFILVMGLLIRGFGHLSSRLLAAITATWMILVFGRYIQVTASALYGRELNLYWDSRFIPGVVVLTARVAPLWMLGAAIAGVAITLTLLAQTFYWALRKTSDAMMDKRFRPWLTMGAGLMVALFALQRTSGLVVFHALFPTPAAQGFVRQIQLIIDASAESRPLPAGPALDSDLSVVKGADVLLVFVEAYGAVSYDNPEFARRLQPSRTRFESDVRDTQRSVVSTFVTSPTFGGSSWLAHISLLTGIEIRDADANARVMAQSRLTLLDTFSRHGYRTIALMPGLQAMWPEGRFYKFDEIYNAARLKYSGPQFGWFDIPDQISLERLNQFELRASPRAPLFVFYPTVSTHVPFSPTPPYQSDWRRAGASAPFDQATVKSAYLVQPDWNNLGPGYVEALSYDFEVFGGFLRDQAPRDLVMILIGDHQPLAAVSGENASWEVPVHVISNRSRLLERLIARGFRAGLTPEHPPLGAMHTLLPVLLDAFGDQEPALKK